MHAARAGRPEDGGHRGRGGGQEGIGLPAKELRPSTQMRNGGLLMLPSLLPRGGDEARHTAPEFVVEEIGRGGERFRASSSGGRMVAPRIRLGGAVLGGQTQSNDRRVSQRSREENLAGTNAASRLGPRRPNRRQRRLDHEGRGLAYG